MLIVVYILAGLVGVFIILALIAPKETRIERSISLNVPQQVAYDHIRYFENFNKWSPWNKRDPDMEQGIKGTDGEVGAVAWWKGNKQVGEGEQETMKLEAPSLVQNELRFFKPFSAVAEAYFKIEAEGDGSKVTWGYFGKNKFPFSIMMIFMNMDKAIGGDYEEGLQKMKDLVEA